MRAVAMAAQRLRKFQYHTKLKMRLSNEYALSEQNAQCITV